MYLSITAQQEEDPYAEWRQVWPSRADLSTMPVQWPFALRGLKKHPTLGTWSPLPPSINGEWSSAAIADLRHAGLATASSRLERQRRKIDKDWTRAKALCEGQLEYNDYIYHWLVVNTRSFYFDETEDAARFVDSRDDNMALCPFIDYFNHADRGCTVAYNETGYSVTADRAYRRGDELLISYGDHDNDLLAVDYGFVLADNVADVVPLDDLVFFGSAGVYKHKDLLSEHNYFGNYKLGPEGPCYRTTIAAALRVLDEPDWLKLVAGTRELSPDEETQVNAIIKDKWIATWMAETRRALQAWGESAMHDSDTVPDYARQVAVARWTQIEAILKAGLKAMDS